MTPVKSAVPTEPETRLRPIPEDGTISLRAKDLRELLRKEAEEWGAPSDTADILSRNVVGHLRTVFGTEVERTGVRSRLKRLDDILKDPELLVAPEALVSKFAWRARVVMLAAREKGGKSTVAAAVAAALTAGSSFLGESCEAGTVLWLGLEEHPGDLVRKLVSFRVNPEAFVLLDRVEAPLADLMEAVDEVQPDLVVVDTLPAFVRHLEIEAGSSQGWTEAMGFITEVARDSNAAILLLHHATKGTGEYRDSTAIGANVDMILTMKEDAGDPSLRRVETRGRFSTQDFGFHLEGDPMEGKAGAARFKLTGEAISVPDQVVAFVTRHPKCSTRMVRDGVAGRAEEVSITLTRLERKGRIRNEGSPSHSKWVVVPQSAGNPRGTRAEPVGNRSENGRRAFP